MMRGSNGRLFQRIDDDFVIPPFHFACTKEGMHGQSRMSTDLCMTSCVIFEHSILLSGPIEEVVDPDLVERRVVGITSYLRILDQHSGSYTG